jgi:hypothetical protein
MDHEDEAADQRRQNFLTLLLTTVLAAFCIFVLVLITGGFFLYVVFVAAAIAAIGLFHYLLWGKFLSDQFGGEREREEEVRRRAQEENWARPARHHFRR